MPASPLERTLDLLCRDRSGAGEAVLLAAADGPAGPVRRAAVKAVLDRATPRVQLELLARLDDLADEERAVVLRNADRLRGALRLGLSHPDAAVAVRAVRFAAEAQRFRFLPELLAALGDGRGDVTAAARAAVGGLVDTLVDAARGGPALRDPSAAVAAERSAAAAAIVENLSRLPSDRGTAVDARDLRVGWLLAVGGAADAELARVLRESDRPLRESCGRVLRTATHPGVLDLVCELLDRPHPPPAVLSAVRTRTDPPFVHRLLDWAGRGTTTLRRANLRQVGTLPWLTADPVTLERTPAALQPALATLAECCGVDRKTAGGVRRWLLRHGSADGRAAVEDLLRSLRKPEADEVIGAAAASRDASVVVWAVGRLREHPPQDATFQLLDLLDHPAESVREAARGVLTGYHVERVVESVVRAPEKITPTTGRVLRKLDPSALRRVRDLLTGPIRRDQVRAAQAVGRLGWVPFLRPPLVALLGDPDPSVRRTAANVLAADDSPLVRRALARAARDADVRVAQAAGAALRTSVTKGANPA